jgi:tripartite-type tricarboxylate transporter receptor subunit TctC
MTTVTITPILTIIITIITMGPRIQHHPRKTDLKNYAISRRLVTQAIGAAALWPLLVASQTPKFPQKPIRMLIPFPAGGGPDSVGRLVAQILSARWGQSVVVDNVAGASGQIGTQVVSRAAPDGYTLLFAPPTPITIAEYFSPKPNYDAVQDLTTIALIGRNPAVIVVPASVPANNLSEFFALAKKDPNKYFYGSPGLGHAFHLTTEIITGQAGVHLTHIPYQGSSKAVMGMLSGDIQFLVQSVESVKEHIKSGRLRALATLENARLPAFPDLPTLTESGFPALGIMNWYGAFLPSKTPSDIVNFWEKELLSLAKDPAFNKKMAEMSFDPVTYGSQEFKRIMTVERAQWAAVIKATQISTQK